EEITANPQATYDGVLRFLSVPSDGRTEFPVFNQRKAHVIPAIGGFVRNPPFPFNKIKNKLRALYFAAGREPPHLYHKYMTVKPPKPKIRPEFRRELIDFFSEDIGILEKAT